MGEDVEQQSFSREDRTRYRMKVRACLDVLERMLVDARFDSEDPATGLEIEPDLVTAHKWFNLAAARGNTSARHYRSEIAQEMAPEEIAAAQKLAREWLQTH